MAKVQITVNDELLRRIDNYADENYMSRSGFLALCAAQYLNTNEVVKAVVDMSVSFKRIAEKGEIDEETVKQLKEFEILAKMCVEGRN